MSKCITLDIMRERVNQNQNLHQNLTLNLYLGVMESDGAVQFDGKALRAARKVAVVKIKSVLRAERVRQNAPSRWERDFHIHGGKVRVSGKKCLQKLILEP